MAEQISGTSIKADLTPATKLRAPFQVEEEDRRKFVRIDFAAPVAIRRVKDADGTWTDPALSAPIHGMILNLSAGGVLVDTDVALAEGEVVLLYMTVQDNAPLNDILGVVKRVDIDPDGCLVGVEFSCRDRLTDRLSHAEIELLPPAADTFVAVITTVLESYLEPPTEAKRG